MPEQLHRTTRSVLVWLFALLLMPPLLYIVSIGPAAPLLLYHGGDTGYQVWQTVYGNPLGKLPPPLRSAVNSYLSVCDKTYWRYFSATTSPSTNKKSWAAGHKLQRRRATSSSLSALYWMIDLGGSAAAGA